MKMLFLVLVFVGTLSVSGQGDKPKLDDLKWIAGCWEINQPDKNRFVSEQWMTPLGGAMLGMSRTVRNGKMTGFEQLRIVEDATGIHYISKPSENKEETAFKLVKWSASEAVFENPTHDFPQRIIYRFSKPDYLSARIEGTMNGKSSGFDFPYVKARCE